MKSACILMHQVEPRIRWLRYPRTMRIFLILVGLALIPIWITRYPPLQDYPDWLLQAQILRHLHDPTFGFAEHYTALNFPVPNLGSVALSYRISSSRPFRSPGSWLSVFTSFFSPLPHATFYRDRYVCLSWRHTCIRRA